MKRGMVIGLSVLGAVLLFIIILVIWSVSSYNELVKLDENVTKQWGQVENQYQRRTDLIPNLVNTVKGYADFERGVLTDVTNARAKVSQMNVTREVLNDPQAFQRFQEAQGQLSGALSRLLVTVENYPDLKANENFQQLQAQLEGTENRISTERKRFNDDVRNYNVAIKQFPKNILAGMFGFHPRLYFQPTPGAETPPKVQF